MTESSSDDRAAAIERARALMAERNAGPVATPPTAPPAAAAPAPRPAPAKHPATASRIMAAGVAASAGMMLVAAMALAAEADNGAPAPAARTAPQVVEQIIRIEIPTQAVAASPAPAEITTVQDAAPLPAPAEQPALAPAESEGS